jgi:hypothetical protein
MGHYYPIYPAWTRLPCPTRQYAGTVATIVHGSGQRLDVSAIDRRRPDSSLQERPVDGVRYAAPLSHFKPLKWRSARA